MNHYLESVKKFHDTFEHPVGNLETPEALKIRQLRIKLLFEEVKELAEAGDVKGTFTTLCQEHLKDADWVEDGNNVDKLEELDACCDIQYVLSGKILTAGLYEIFDKNFDLVQLNNMNKAHISEDHCQQTIRALQKINNDPPESYTIKKKADGVYILENRHGKLTKPWNHKKVSLKLQ